MSQQPVHFQVASPKERTSNFTFHNSSAFAEMQLQFLRLAHRLPLEKPDVVFLIFSGKWVTKPI